MNTNMFNKFALVGLLLLAQHGIAAENPASVIAQRCEVWSQMAEAIAKKRDSGITKKQMYSGINKMKSSDLSRYTYLVLMTNTIYSYPMMDQLSSKLLGASMCQRRLSGKGYPFRVSNSEPYIERVLECQKTYPEESNRSRCISLALRK